MAILELDDIQSGVLRPRPTPFAATYVILRIDDRAAGRALMRRLSEIVASAAHPESPARDTWVSASLTFAGLEAPRRPAGFARQFLAAIPRRAWRRVRDSCTTSERTLPNTGRSRSAPDDVHVVLTGISTDAAQLEKAVGRARAAYQNVAGITPIWRQDCYALPTETEPFGFKDGISHPAIEGSGIPGTNPHEVPLKPGEFVLGYHRRIRRRLRVPATGDPGPQRQLRRVSKAAPAGRRISPLSQGQRVECRRRGVLGGEDDGALAQRSAALVVSRSRRSRDRRRPGEEQRLSCSKRTIRSDTRRRWVRISGE